LAWHIQAPTHLRRLLKHAKLLLVKVAAGVVRQSALVELLRRSHRFRVRPYTPNP
jgi:hypothetical protein